MSRLLPAQLAGPRAGLILAPLLALALLVAGCSGDRLSPPPEPENRALATIPGMPEDAVIRFWGDVAPANAGEYLQEISREISARATAEGAVPNEGRYDILAMSGGGSDGAYGAGLLSGWADPDIFAGPGKRPEFSLVTGISVGALIAPFAFLGPEYDSSLKRLFTETRTEDIAQLNIFNALFGYALGVTDVRPLEDIFDQIMTAQMVERIGEEHRKGRRLWIGTTYLDAERPVIWDIGAIASSNYAEKRLLIKKILIASASIPGAFPPVLFDVVANGQRYSEMHVDGSVTKQVFVYPGGVNLAEQFEGGVPGMRFGTIYLVRNSQLAPKYQPVDPSVLSIVERSLFTLTKALAISDAETVEQQATRDGWRLLRTSVPPEFDFPIQDFFDPQYMTALFEIGYNRALNGIAWETVVDPDAPKPTIAMAK